MSSNEKIKQAYFSLCEENLQVVNTETLDVTINDETLVYLENEAEKYGVSLDAIVNGLLRVCVLDMKDKDV